MNVAVKSEIEETNDEICCMPRAIILKGIFLVLLSVLLLTFTIFDITETSFTTKGYIFVYFFTSIITIMAVSMLLFVITCISSLIIMAVNKKFSMRNLYCVLYEYYSKVIMLNAITAFIVFFWELKVNKIIILIYAVCSILFFIQLYNNMIKYAYVYKLSAKILVGIMSLFSIAIAVGTVLL